MVQYAARPEYSTAVGVESDQRRFYPRRRRRGQLLLGGGDESVWEYSGNGRGDSGDAEINLPTNYSKIVMHITKYGLKLTGQALCPYSFFFLFTDGR